MHGLLLAARGYVPCDWMAVLKSLKNGQMEVIAHAEMETMCEKVKRDMGKENKKANQIPSST